MQLVEDRFRGRLAEDETVQTLTSGRLLEDDGGGRTTIGLTDRRFLCVSKAGEFVDVRYDYVCSIRSRPRTKVQYRTRDGFGRTRYVLGGLLALTLVAVGVSVALSIGPTVAAASIGLGLATAAVAAAVDVVRKRTGVGRTIDQIFVGTGVLALLVLAGIGLFAASVAASLFVLVTAGGLVLAGYAAHHREELGGVAVERHREMVVEINTVDGDTVNVAVDTDSDLDRELSASVHRSEPAAVDVPSIRSPVD